jgi:predicted nuclease of predicted toxin-antitoxin system
MTKDRDFLHLLCEQGPPPQVIWLRVGNSSNQALQAVLLRTLSGDNEVGRRFASTNCYQERLSLGNTAVSSPRAGA